MNFVNEIHIKKLREINHKLLETTDSYEQGEIDRLFHGYISRMNDEAILPQYLEDLQMRQALVQCWIPFRPDRIPHSYQEHEGIIQSMEWGETELAVRQTEAHFLISQRSLCKKLKEYEETHLNLKTNKVDVLRM